ncbi:MAG: cell division protein ZapA [Lachnospiraceae bacterium]|nr:cell division protein ZapA [Lachnospiraceae bacterium]MCR5345656.1 cell division protein ZapA [Lachnospiraceae bacterium]
MATKISADVLIGGKVYTLSGYESEEYLHKVASFLNKKIDELVNGLEGYNRLPQDTKALLLQLNIADEYFKSKERVDELETDLADYKQNQADMKHELIALQIKMDTLKDSIMELETRNKELLHNKEQLEAALEKKLL